MSAQSAEPESRPRFQTETMSGVAAGSRSLHYFRIRLRLKRDDARRWGRIALREREQPTHFSLESIDSPELETAPLLALEAVGSDELDEQLPALLQQTGYEALICGTCGHWQPLTGQQDESGVRLGACRLKTEPLSFPPELLRQSGLAVECPGWTESSRRREPEPEPSAAPKEDEAPRPLGGLLSRLWRRPKTNAVPGQPILDRARSTTGSLPCFTCHGSLANLGARNLSTVEGDKRTLSVWRCRVCHVYLLNDFIDRWERLDTLEIEEKFYRLAPFEALSLLEEAGADAESWMRRCAELTTNRVPMSKQKRHGR